MNNILITGSTGLIGDELTQQLRKSNLFKVYCLSRSLTPSLTDLKIDLSEDWNESILPEKIDVIIHLAQSEKFRDFPQSAQEVFEVNTNCSLRLLEYGRKAGAKKFIFASSGGVYGNSDTGFHEESPLKPNKDLGFYLTTKYCSELLVENYTPFFDVNILRFFFVYGEKQKKNMLVPRLIDSVRSGKPISLQGQEGIKINPIYVNDAAKAIVKIIGSSGSYNVNIAGDETLSIKQLGDIIASRLSKAAVYEYQPGEVKNLIGDISRMKQIQVPEISFSEAIKKMIDHHG